MIQALLLAAGRATRFGGDKLLHRLADGRPLVLHALEPLQAVAGEVLAVVRPDHPELAAVLRRAGCRLVICERSAAGMGHSLAAGVAASADADGWLVALGDMPWIHPISHAAVLQALRRGACVAAACCGGRRGHPVGFAACYREALMGLEGDIGARQLLADGGLVGVEVSDPGVLRDVDRLQDLPEAARRVVP